MRHEHTTHEITEEDRREFLKALGVTGLAAAGGMTLSEVREELSAGTAEELAPVGQAIQADLSGSIDAELVADQQATLSSAANELPAALESGVPAEAPGTAFASVAEAGRPIYEHLEGVGFFESTTDHLPEITPASLSASVETFAGSEELAAPLESVEMAGEAGVDLLATVIGNAERLSGRHWVATDELTRDQFEFAEKMPPLTQAAAGGVLLWFENLDDFLWTNETLVTEEILESAAWYGQSMAAGFQLMAEGAKHIGAESGTLAEDELAALLSTGFAVQAIAQTLLLPDVAWITDPMRADHRTDLEVVTE